MTGKSSDRRRPDWSTPTPAAAGRRYAVDGAGTDDDRLGRADPSGGAGRVCGRRDHRVRHLVPRPVGPGRPAVPDPAGPALRGWQPCHHARRLLVPRRRRLVHPAPGPHRRPDRSHHDGDVCDRLGAGARRRLHVPGPRRRRRGRRPRLADRARVRADRHRPGAARHRRIGGTVVHRRPPGARAGHPRCPRAGVRRADVRTGERGEGASARDRRAQRAPHERTRPERVRRHRRARPRPFVHLRQSRDRAHPRGAGRVLSRPEPHADDPPGRPRRHTRHPARGDRAPRPSVPHRDARPAPGRQLALDGGEPGQPARRARGGRHRRQPPRRDRAAPPGAARHAHRASQPDVARRTAAAVDRRGTSATRGGRCCSSTSTASAR